ncbi:MAG: glycosyltransferase family 2 protein [bacterium]|nr:glycosyltransferase family 2 protein [bacterium]
MSIPCSVYIVTLDCGQWLRQTLDSVSDFAEVVILDSGSSDDTYAIAQQYPNTRIRHQDWQGYAGQKALALAECTQPWALNLDGDEELSAELKKEIESVIAENDIDGLITPIRDAFMGRLCSEHTRLHAKIRFFRRTSGSYDLGIAVHEAVQVEGNVRRATGTIYHYGEQDIAIKVDKNNNYSSLKAREKAAKGKRASMLKLVLVMPLTFIKCYFLRRDFLNGWQGFIGSMINSFYAFMKEAKLYELTRDAGKK